MGHRIIVFNRDEIYWVRVAGIAYIQADDHYSAIHMMNGTKQLVPFGLSRLCEIMAHQIAFDKFFVRIGRSYVLGLSNLTSISVTKGVVQFSDSVCQMRLTLSKAALRDAVNSVQSLIHEETDGVHEKRL